MSQFEREIGFFENYFKEFYLQQIPVVRKKIDWTLMLIKTTRIVPEKYLKHLSHTNGLWEVRVSAGNGIVRIFCFFDQNNLVVLLSGFQKKTRKTPRSEIKKAERLKREYYEES